MAMEISLVSYEQKRHARVLKYSMAASVALPEVRERQWPVLAAFRNAADSLPFFQPHKAELKDAAQAVIALCSRT
jgi:hypothetical protein